MAMTTITKRLLFMLTATAFILFLILVMQPLLVVHFRDYIDILFPKGIIGLEERNLLLVIQGLMLLVIIPVYLLTFIFSWKYRFTNKKAIYDPDLIDNTLAEYLWWGIPALMTILVASLTWLRTDQLDPYKAIDSDKKPLKIQAVALQWKWLFIYPEEGIASVNFFQFPRHVPLHFEITSDAPMNSLWIPKLGGQIYAMPGMRTELFLIADEAGDFRGSSANLSGEGFAGMHFIARSSSEDDYEKWVDSVKKSTTILDMDSYNKLAEPSQNNRAESFQLKDDKLFQRIIMKYMAPMKSE